MYYVNRIDNRYGNTTPTRVGKQFKELPAAQREADKHALAIVVNAKNGKHEGFGLLGCEGWYRSI